MKKLRWGIMGNAKIARDWLIPAIQESLYAELVAVASRDLDRAGALADSLAGGAKPCLAFGSYEALLASDDIDAVYIPLPNHLHVPWSIKALEAGKHVLCEKPLGLNSREVEQLKEAANRLPELLVMEAFMYRFHPQWLRVRELIESEQHRCKQCQEYAGYWWWWCNGYWLLLCFRRTIYIRKRAIEGGC
jgi:predicted dehydrogenase